MRQHSVTYIIIFSAVVCIVCSLFVSGTAVGLRSRIAYNMLLDKQFSVLRAIGEEDVSEEAVDTLFGTKIIPQMIDIKTGDVVEADNPSAFDTKKAAKDPATSFEAPANEARVVRVADQAVVYQIMDEGGALDMVVLPIRGAGLWSTMYGFLAVDKDGETVRGITFYEHGETPGLGGEIDNPEWQAKWIGRKLYDTDGEVVLDVIKGAAGPADADPHRVDGLSGATLTGRGVANTLRFWFSADGFKPFLEKMAGN